MIHRLKSMLDQILWRQRKQHRILRSPLIKSRFRSTLSRTAPTFSATLWLAMLSTRNLGPMQTKLGEAKSRNQTSRLRCWATQGGAGIFSQLNFHEVDPAAATSKL